MNQRPFLLKNRLLDSYLVFTAKTQNSPTENIKISFSYDAMSFTSTGFVVGVYSRLYNRS
jgi:hypothetical protein